MPTPAKPLPTTRCTAPNTYGERCGQRASAGSNVCSSHGGSTRQVKKRAAAQVESARLRLFGSADDAVATLEALLAKGTADMVRLNAAKEVLDRVGLKTATEIQVEVTDARDPASTVRERLAALAAAGAIPGEVVVPDDTDPPETDRPTGESDPADPTDRDQTVAPDH